MQNSAAVHVPHVENELVRDYLSEVKGDTDHLRRYIVQLDVHISQTKDWNALHRAINDHKPKDAKQIVFGYMDKDRLDERKIVEVALNQLDPKAARKDNIAGSPLMEIQMIDDHRIPGGDGEAWPEHVCRVHLEVPIVHDDWGPLREALRANNRGEAYTIIARNISEEHLTDPIRVAVQAALGWTG